MCSSLEVVVSFIEVLLLDLNLGDFVECTALQKLIIAHSDHLLKIQNGIVAIIQLLQCFSLIEVRFWKSGVSLRARTRNVLNICKCVWICLYLGFIWFFFCKLAQLIEIFQSFVVILHLKIKDTPLHEPLLHAWAINLDGLWVGLQCPVIVTDPLQTVALAQISETVFWRHLDHYSEVG